MRGSRAALGLLVADLSFYKKKLDKKALKPLIFIGWKEQSNERLPLALEISVRTYYKKSIFFINLIN